MGNRINNKGQVTIFIIIVIIIVALVALFFLLRTEKLPFVPTKTETNPSSFMSTCIEDKVKESIDKVLSQGGVINPENYHLFNNLKVEYLCYNAGHFEPCINQHPMFLKEISEGLKVEIDPEVKRCFSELENSLKKLGYEVNIGANTDVNISLTQNKVLLDIKKAISITKSGETSNLDEIKLSFSSSLYNLANIANQIANSETIYCYFEYLGYMVLHPEYIISIKKMSDSTKVYTIKDEKTKDELNIAIKGCSPI